MLGGAARGAASTDHVARVRVALPPGARRGRRQPLLLGPEVVEGDQGAAGGAAGDGERGRSIGEMTGGGTGSSRRMSSGVAAAAREK